MGNEDTDNFISTDKLYLLEPKEVYGINGGTAALTIRQVDYYSAQGVTTSNYSGAIKQLNGKNKDWWLRAANYGMSYNFYAVRMDGKWDFGTAIGTRGASPAFRIA